MATFVLVHGAWGGGWQWRGVARVLRAAAHEVTAPTLAGLGERARLGGDGVTLLTHIDELADHLWFEDLADVVLVGWSYGIVPVEGVADRMPERLSRVVSLDGPPVHEGKPLGFDGWPAEQVQGFLDTGWVRAPTADDLADVIDDLALRTFVGERERSQPTATWTAPFPDTGGSRWQVPHVYLACTEPPIGEAFTDEELAERAEFRADPRWDYRELSLNHLGMLYAPEVVAVALLDVIQARP